jgi:hypothetical protein
MAESSVDIVSCQETIFFTRVDEPRIVTDEPVLCQHVLVTIANRDTVPVAANVSVTEGGREVVTPLMVAPGIAEYTCFGPTLWPDRPPDPAAVVRLETENAVVETVTPLGHHRPWTVFLLSDLCTDHTWVYDNDEDVRRDDAAITAAEMDVAESLADGATGQESHFNLVHTLSAQYFLETYPEQADRFFEHVRRGTITLNPIYNMVTTGNLSLEELIRQLYPARALALREGLDIGYANHQETPTIAWITATVLAGSGVNHLVKSILPYECPWAARLEEPPVFLWEGPDGSRVLVRRRNTDYVEGQFVLRGLRPTNTALHDRICPEYEALGDAYPFDAIGLVGSYGDLDRVGRDWPARKAATVAAYNDQGWDYPKLIDASHKQFWDAIDAQIAARDIALPVSRGDYGAAWDAWPACLAHDAAGWRRAQERAATADKLAVVAATLDPQRLAALKAGLAAGWQNMTFLADHAWNGANDANRALNAALRRRWQMAANGCFDGIIDDSLRTLAEHVPGGDGDRILVFNGLGWPRDGVVRIDGEEGETVVDVATGDVVPTQQVRGDDGSALVFEARGVPAVGYRVFARSTAPPPARPSPWQSGPAFLEGPFYRVEISPETGGIVSLYDKARGRELVDRDSPYHLNQCLYWSDGTEHTPRAATIAHGEAGPVFAEVHVRGALKNTEWHATITLFANIDRVDICNELRKRPTSERQELDFAFPFAVPDRRYRFEAPGAIVEAGRDQLPGAGQAVTVVRHFVDVANDEFGATLAMADSFLIEFGHRTTLEDPLQPDPSNSTVLALALDNVIDWDESIRDQAGIDRFVFRYAVRGHAGPFSAPDAVRFGWEDNNELLTVPLPAGQRGSLPDDVHGFVAVDQDDAILTTLKLGEDDGIVARLWNCADDTDAVTIDAAGIGVMRPIAAASRTDLLERDTEAIPVRDGRLGVPLPPRGLATVRFTLAAGDESAVVGN